MEAQRSCIYAIERAFAIEKHVYSEAMNYFHIISDEVCSVFSKAINDPIKYCKLKHGFIYKTFLSSRFIPVDI
jgi:hypothetical protein